MTIGGGVGLKDVNEEYENRISFWKPTKWKLTWHFSFNKCSVTGAIIWPFTKAYFGERAINTDPMWWAYDDIEHQPPIIEEQWITQSAYTYLNLIGKQDLN